MTEQGIYVKRRLDTLAAVMANPEHHDQRKWHCGTSHCFAGFGELLYEAKKKKKEFENLLKEDYSIFRDLSSVINNKYYGLTKNAWFTIIDGENDLFKLQLFVHASIKGGDRIDLSGKDLSGVDFADVSLKGANLSNVNFTNANLEGANLSNTDLTYTILEDVNLTGVIFNKYSVEF